MAILLVHPADVGAEPRVELYRTAHRSAEELLPIAQDLLAPEGSASADARTGILVLRAEPEALDQALEVLRRLDAALAEFRVRAVVTTRAELRGLGVGLDGPLVIGRDAEVRLALAGLVDHSRSRIRTELRVREGSWGALWTGREIPVDVHVLRSRGRGGRARRETVTHLQPAGRSGLRVRARPAGDGSVELDVEPVVERPQGEELAVIGARLRVRLRPGELAVVADTSTQGESSTDRLLGMDAQSTRDGSAVLLQVERID